MFLKRGRSRIGTHQPCLTQIPEMTLWCCIRSIYIAGGQNEIVERWTTMPRSCIFKIRILKHAWSGCVKQQVANMDLLCFQASSTASLPSFITYIQWEKSPHRNGITQQNRNWLLLWDKNHECWRPEKRVIICAGFDPHCFDDGQRRPQ